MRIAAISDIHGDFCSMQIVWRDIEARGLSGEIVLNAGDTVAFGPSTMNCIDFIRCPSHRIVSVGGNHDYSAAEFPQKQEDYQREWGLLRPDKYEALKRASADLAGDARDYLRHLPAVETMEIAGCKLSLSHYAPAADKEGLFAETTEARLRQIASEIETGIDIVVTGHTHSAFVRRAGNLLFVNPGTIGRAMGRPTYAEIEIEPDRFPTARIITCCAAQA